MCLVATVYRKEGIKEMATSSDMVQSALDMASGKQTCSTCWHGRDGHCAMYSCACANDVSNHARTPCWWTSYEEGEEYEKRVLR